MAMILTDLAEGCRVTYHGSIVECHGGAVVTSVYSAYDGLRCSLVTDNGPADVPALQRRLDRVRPASITFGCSTDPQGLRSVCGIPF
jgi:hypothetical protein